MSYSHFTLIERTYLYELLKEGNSIRSIAAFLGRHPSSVSRELKRNSIDGIYSPFKAEMAATDRKARTSIYAIPQESELWLYIIDKLKKYWSPETISGRWNKKHPNEKQLHFSTIYRYIHKGLLPNITPQGNLRRRGKKSDPNSRQKYQTIHPDRIIPEWPEVIRNRSRIGDWEGDTILGGVGKGLAVTLVDRQSRYLIAAPNSTKAAVSNRKLIESLLKGNPVNSISFDNGVEFADFHTLEDNLHTKIYFAEPHKPWQRGTNENTNGLLRFFYPKGCDFKAVTDEEFQKVVELINNRPRKCLNWRTPAEAYHQRVALD